MHPISSSGRLPKFLFVLIAFILLIGFDVSAAAASEPAQNDIYTYHTVRRGETLSSIAYYYGTTIPAILEFNTFISDPNDVSAGTVLAIPYGVFYPQPQPATASNTHHVIQYGETLGMIANRYGVTLSSLLQANPYIANANYIYAGTVLTIPSYQTPSAPTSTPANGCRYHHLVTYGDTLARLSRHYGVSIHAIAAANHIQNLNRIYVGQQLCIP